MWLSMDIKITSNPDTPLEGIRTYPAIPKNVSDILDSIFEYLKYLPIIDLPEGATPEPKAFLLYHRCRPETLEIKGYGDITLIVSFYQWELTLKLPNHKNNLILIRDLTKTLCNDPTLPFDQIETLVDDSDVSFHVMIHRGDY